MAYVPPHKRLTTSTSTPTTSSTATATATLSSPPSSSSSFVPLDIPWAPHSVRRFVILSQARLLQFQPYQGATFQHLKGCPSYTLKAATASDQDTDSSSESQSPSFTLHDNAESNAQVIVPYLVETLQHDLTSFIVARSKSHLDNQIPDIYLKFGHILFHPIDRVLYDWKRDYTSDYLEKRFPARKTFLDRLSSNAIPPLWEKASRDALQIQKKHRYFIEVEDKTRPDTYLLCKCSISGHDTPKSGRTENAETSQKKSDGLQQLRLRKVRVGGPVRHMVADIACIGKCQDLRFMVCTKDQSLSDEEVSQLEACVSHAVVDKDLEQGLEWPKDGFTSFSNRFGLLGDYQTTSYSFQQGGVEWKLQKFRNSRRRIIELKPIILKKFLKGCKEYSLDDVILSLNNLLEVAWKCLSSATNYVDPLPIENSSNSIHKFVIAPHAFPELLRFEVYNKYLYTLHKASAAADIDLSSKSWTTPSFACDENVAESLFHTLRDDLTSIIVRLKTHVNNVVPDIFMEFGHILFHPTDRDSFDKKQHYTPEYLEKHFQAGTNEIYFGPLSSDAIWERAKRGTLRVRKKHRFSIKVEDKSRPNTYYQCKCSIFRHDAPKSNRINDYDETSKDNSDGLQQLRLRKVRMKSQAHHMVANIVCIDKSHDLRLMVCTKAYLSEEDMSHLEACINLAVVDKDSEGGLMCMWPEDGFASFSNRFELIKDYQETCYSFQEEGVEWKLWRMKSGSRRMEVKPIVVKEFLKGRKEFSLDDAMMSLNKLLEVVWKFLKSDTDYNVEHQLPVDAWSPHIFVLVPYPSPELLQFELLQFEPYQGDYFLHPEGYPLYTLKEASAPEDIASSSESRTPSSTLHENADICAEVVQSIFHSVQDDLTPIIARLVRLNTHANNVITPDISLKFGHILFHPIDSVSFDWKRDYAAEYVETQFRDCTSRTFFDHICAHVIPPLWEKASRDALLIRTKHRYFIQVKDKWKPDTYLLCKCAIYDHDATENAETSEENSDGPQQLRLRKVSMDFPVAHMVADIVCIGKSHDLRLMVCTKAYLSEEEMSLLEAFINQVVVEEEVEGGLRWPEDGFLSFSNRFEILGSFHMTCYSFREQSVEWKLYKNNSRGSTLMEVKPILLKDFLKGHIKECSLHDVTDSLFKLLEVAWKY